MQKTNKIFIILLLFVFSLGISYVAFSWSEPEGDMPSQYKIPINTSSDNQDVDMSKPKVGNLDSDKLDGYDSSDLLASTGSGAIVYTPKCDYGCYCNPPQPICSSCSCSPPSCADGFESLGTGCSANGRYNAYYSGHCERYCYKEF